MCENFFNNVEEISHLKALSETIPGLEMKCPVWWDFKCAIQFTYRLDDLEYYFILTPILQNEEVIHYLLFDKVSLLNKDFIAHGTYENFPFGDYYKLDGGLFFPKEISYEDAIHCIQNIDMEDAYDPSKKFWMNSL